MRSLAPSVSAPPAARRRPCLGRNCRSRCSRRGRAAARSRWFLPRACDARCVQAEGHAMAPRQLTQKVSTADQKKRLADGNVVGLGGLWLPYAVYHPLSLRSGWHTAGLGLYLSWKGHVTDRNPRETQIGFWTLSSVRIRLGSFSMRRPGASLGAALEPRPHSQPIARRAPKHTYRGSETARAKP